MINIYSVLFTLLGSFFIKSKYNFGTHQIQVPKGDKQIYKNAKSTKTRKNQIFTKKCKKLLKIQIIPKRAKNPKKYQKPKQVPKNK